MVGLLRITLFIVLVLPIQIDQGPMMTGLSISLAANGRAYSGQPDPYREGSVLVSNSCGDSAAEHKVCKENESEKTYEGGDCIYPGRPERVLLRETEE